jgi:branched-chain amino acid transport system substrate-binding protein
MLRRSILVLLGSFALASVDIPSSIAQAPSNSSDPVLIGVPLPLTGNLSQAGQSVLRGIRYAAEQANRSGGLLGHQIKLVVEDTKGESNTAATVATGMATRDKVYAFVGGFGSTADMALLQSIKRFQPIFIHPSSGSVKLEQTFGSEPWYFHVYVWDYHRQAATVRFFKSLNPQPKTIAIAYEDSLFGSDAARYAEQYMLPAGFQIVMREPFKSGTPDFSPVLHRVQRLDPDIFYVIGYAADNLQVVRQARELNISPKLMLLAGAGERRPDFGDAGTNIAVILEWAAGQKTPDNSDLIKGAAAIEPKTDVISSQVMTGYTAMQSLVEAVRRGNSLDRDSVLKTLGDATFKTPFGELEYQKSTGGALHQMLTDKDLIVVQYRAKGEDVVFPPEKAGGTIVYPVKP